MDSTKMTVAQLKSRRTLYLIFATLTLLVLGLIYAWSIFAVPIGTVYADYKPLLPQVFQVSMFAFCLSALLGAQIVKRVSPKASILLASVLWISGFSCAALFTSAGMWALFIFYGVLAASGCGIAYNAIIALVNPWFPDRIGFCSGVMMMGFGISTLLFSMLANALSLFERFDWTTIFFVIAVLEFVILILLAFVVKQAPSNAGVLLGVTSSAAAGEDTPTQKQFLFKTKSFWLYFTWSTFVVSSTLTLIGTAAQGAETLHLDEMLFSGFGVLLVGLVSTVNGLSRIINGTIFDKLGLLTVMRMSSSIALVALASIAASFAFNLGPVYIVAALCVAFTYGAIPVMGSAFSRQRFGAESFAMNLGIVNCNAALASVINIIVGVFLGSAAGPNATIFYTVLTVFAAISLMMTFLFGNVYKKDLAQIEKEREAA